MAELGAFALFVVAMAGIAAFSLAVWALFFVVWGAIFLFGAAKEAGGIPLIIYFVVWITSAPIMLIICFVLGIAQKVGRQEEKRWAEKTKSRNSN